jgi:hypothetical protein
MTTGGNDNKKQIPFGNDNKQANARTGLDIVGQPGAW